MSEELDFTQDNPTTSVRNNMFPALTLESLQKAIDMLDITPQTFFDGINIILSDAGLTAKMYQARDYPSKLIIQIERDGRCGYHVIDISNRLKSELELFKDRVTKLESTGLPFEVIAP